jgi:hypothetical protein
LPPGGTVRIEFMHNATTSGRTILFTKRDSTMFSYNAPYPPADGIWGELVPFSPLNACKSLQLSNYTKKVGGKIQFQTVGPYPHVIALVARGDCSFEEKFDFVDNVPNVIGMLMFDLENGDNLSNDIEISTFEMTSIPGFLVDYERGQELLRQVNQMRNEDSRRPADPLWIKTTLQYISYDGPIQSILQYTLLFVMALLGVAFAASVYMHFHIYRLQRQLGARRNEEARNSIVIDEAFLEKLPIRKYRKILAPDTDVAGVSLPLVKEEMQAPIEMDDHIIHAHAPPNETCPICLDEFTFDEILNELPCGHFYHMSCIRPWLQNRSPECPMCKEDVRDAFVIPPEPVDSQVASRTFWSRTRGFFKRHCCCTSDRAAQASGDNNSQGAGMTEVRIVTPTSAETGRTRDGTMHQVPLDQLANPI